MRDHICNILLFVLISTTCATAQQLSLDSCKILALKNNTKIQNAELAVASAKNTKSQVVSKYFPNIKLVGGAYHALNPLFEVGIDNISNANARDLLNTLYFEYGSALGLPNSFTLFQQGYMANIMAMQPIYAGGQIVNGNKLAKLGVEVAEIQAEMAEQELVMQVEENYWLIVSLCEKRKTVEQAQQLLDTLYRDVNGAVAAGLATQNDLLKVTLKQNELKSNLVKIDNGITLAKMALCQSVGVAFSDSIQLTDTLSETIAEPMAYYVDNDNAVGQRYETQLLDLNIEAEQLQRKLTLGATLPQIGLGATYGYNHLSDYTNKFNGMLFATIQIPLTDWCETSYKLRSHNNKIQMAENNRRDLTEKMSLQVQQAWNELNETYTQITIARETVENAQQNYNVTEQNYRAGLVPLSEVLEAQTVLRQAIDQQNNELINYKLKLAHYQQLTHVAK